MNRLGIFLLLIGASLISGVALIGLPTFNIPALANCRTSSLESVEIPGKILDSFCVPREVAKNFLVSPRGSSLIFFVPNNEVFEEGDCEGDAMERQREIKAVNAILYAPGLNRPIQDVNSSILKDLRSANVTEKSLQERGSSLILLEDKEPNHLRREYYLYGADVLDCKDVVAGQNIRTCEVTKPYGDYQVQVTIPGSCRAAWRKATSAVLNALDRWIVQN